MANYKRWVSNTSPLILLGKIGQLELLTALAPSLVVPQVVMTEIAAGTDIDPCTNAILMWAKTRTIEDMAIIDEVIRWDLGAGESQVLSHCYAGDAVAVLDDGAARACAQSLGISIIGTLGIILRAKKQGIILEARPLIEQLLAVGSRLDRNLVESVLQQIGE
ncbi:hypothetical protein TI05_04615 [Achromatium sp. WMS3]|nr:hypothetical protein TI05_04615 [Achromatium sp. WMS3]